MSISWPTKLYIDGQWTPSSSNKSMPLTNPANGERLTEVALAGADDIDRAVKAARRAFDEGPWPRLDPLERGRYLYKISEVLRQRIEDFALTDTLNVGKPIRDTRGLSLIHI